MDFKFDKKALKNFKFPREILPLDEKGKHLSRVSAEEFISETYKFLKTFYRGCYDAYLTQAGYKTIFVCIENFAIVLKGLVKAVFGRELIIVRFKSDEEKLLIDMEFNTSVVSDELREEMHNLAKEGGFSISFEDRLASIRLDYMKNALPYVNSHSTRIVYNTLMYVFQSERL